MRSRSRRIWLVVAGTAVVGVVGVLALLRDPVPRMRARRSELATAITDSSWVDGAYVLTPVRLTARSGLTVDLLLRRAASDSGRRLPVAVLLGGHQTGRRAARFVGETRGVLVASLSYPFAGNSRPDPLTFLLEIPLIRAAFLDTPPAIMLALDYLWSRGDVDTARVEAVGVSLGAPFVTMAAALDPRISRVWALHGSGGSYTPLEANMRRTIPFGPLRAIAALTANVIINGPHLDPVRWAPRISPRPFIMVSAEDDERLPRSAVDELFQSAREPKEHIWMPGAHVHLDSATVQTLVGIVMSRMTGEARSLEAVDTTRASPAPKARPNRVVSASHPRHAATAAHPADATVPKRRTN